jgi:DNA-binding CsgD family transcriptional regulator
VLLGRELECAAIGRLLDEARDGASGGLLLRGEPGIGKTALVGYAVERATGMLVVRAQGVQSETEVAFGGLLEVTRPLLARIDELPDRQAAALRAALALDIGPPPDRLTVGAATLTLLAAAAEETPLLVALDDAQWLDAESAEALGFAVRRLHAERVAVVVATRVGEGREFDPAGLDAIDLFGLSHEAAGELLAVSGVEGDDAVARFHAATGGNPLALLELPRWLGGVDPAATGAVNEPVRVGEELEAAFAARAEALGASAREALLVLAASSTEDAAAIAAGVAAAGLSTDQLGSAEDAGLIRITMATIRFRHPLVRSALYHAATPSARRAAHSALAVALDGRDPEAAAWHRAAAATGPDAGAADALEEIGDRSTDRGASAAASAAYEASARLSAGESERLRRLSLAGRQAWLAGQIARARGLVDEATAACDDDGLRAELLYLRGEIEQFTGQPAVAQRMLLEAAGLAAPRDPTRAALMLGEAADACLHLDDHAYDETITAFEALVLPAGGLGEFRRHIASSQRDSHFGLDEYAAHARSAVRIVERESIELRSAVDLIWAGRAHWILGDYGACVRFGEAAVASARESAPGLLPEALRLVATGSRGMGRWNAASTAASEGIELARALGQGMIHCALAALLAAIAAARGQAAACHGHAEEAIGLADELRLGVYRLRAERALALLALGTGRLDDAIDALTRIDRAVADSGNHEFFISPAPDLIEALARADRADDAQPILRGLEALASPEPGERAIAGRCRALLDGDGFDAIFEHSIADHAEWDNPFERARTELCFGERLRRARRRREAREQLRSAVATFELLAAEPWAARAATELRATGETVRRRDRTADEELTPQELQIALHAAEGESNREIGAALFLSPRTVEFHLTRVYRKLSVHSRAELIRRFSAGQAPRPGD